LASPPIVSALVPFRGLLPASRVSDASRIDYSKTLTCSAEEKEGGGHGDFILGPVSPKEYKETAAELNGSPSRYYTPPTSNLVTSTIAKQERE
jgi:hypothetical protein